MIPQNELRVNNWYRCKIYNGKNDVIMQFTPQEYKYAHLFEAIPLTPEILEKAGFPIVNGLRWNEQHAIMLWWGEESPHYYSFKYNYLAESVKIRTLHQLQNLYFVLTGQELPITL